MRKFPSLIVLFLANSISGFASGITLLAIPWTLISEMGDTNGKFLNAAMMGSVTFLSLFWGVYAGTLVDRFNRKRIWQTMNGTDAIIMGGIACFGFAFQELPFMLMALATMCTIFTYNVHYPNLYAFVQELFEPKYYSKVNSAIELQGQTTNFLGMGMAGLLIGGSSTIDWWPVWMEIEAWSLWEILLLDSITYAVSFVLISLIRYTPDPDRRIDKGSVVKRIWSGFQFLRERKPLMVFGVASYTIFFTILVVIQVALPVYIHDYLGYNKAEGSILFAQVEMFYALGAITAGLAAIFLNHLIRNNRFLIKQITVLMILVTLIYFTFSFTASASVLIIGSFLVGVSNAGTRILRITYLIRMIPNYIVGRVTSFFRVINVLQRTSMIGLFMLPFFSAANNGPNVVYGLMIMGGMTLLSGVALVAWYGRFEK